MELATASTIAAGGLLLFIWLLATLLKWFDEEYYGRIPKGACLPPGPLGLPFVGNIRTLLNGLSHQRALSWSRIYGPVIRVKAGTSEVIVLNDLDTIRTFLNHKDFLDRSKKWVLSETVDIGFSGYGGATWAENRRFSLKLLRGLGFGRSHMEQVIAEGCQQLLSKIAESQGQPIDLFDLILASISSNIQVFLLGNRYPLGHPEHQRLCEALRDEFRTTRDGNVVSFLPSWTAALLQCVPCSRNGTLTAAMRRLDEFCSTRLDHHMAARHSKEDRDFIDAYLRKREGHDQEGVSSHGLSSLVGNVVSMLVAAAVSPAATLMRHMLLVASSADTIQPEIQREIDAVVGIERQPAWNDRPSTPYAMAFIWETFRRYPPNPLGLPRRACKDVVVDEHFIPEDATVLANIWAAQNDSTIWVNPDKFDPTRFLSSDGSLSGEMLQRVIPFSTGRRRCPGEIFASVEIYVYLTSILQKFRVLPVTEVMVDVNVHYSKIMELGRHKLRCVPRASRAL